MTDNTPSVQAEAPQIEAAADTAQNEAAQVSDQTAETTDKQDKQPTGWEKRVARLTKANSVANQKLQELQAELAKYKQPERDADPEPKEADFDSVEAYAEARGAWKTRKEFREQEAKAKAAERERSGQELAAKKEAVFRQREAEFRKAKPDYDGRAEVFNEALGFVSKDSNSFKAFADAMFSSEVPEAVVYELGNDADALEELLKKSPTEVYRAITRIELKYEASQQPEEKEEIKKVAPPPKPITGSGKVQKSLDQMSYAELKKRMGL